MYHPRNLAPVVLVGAMASAALVGGAANAANVTPDVIFGSGNANGGFTIVQDGSLELGLRAKLRYDLNGQPTNIFPFDGVNTYTFNPDDGNAPANRAIWSFEWSVNTNTDGGGVNLNAYTYNISLTGPGGYSFSYNPFGSFRDVALGTNATGNGGGQSRGFFDNLVGNIPSGFNVAQESENIGFATFGNSDPQALGLYTVTLTAFQGGQEVLSNNININVIPVPAALPLLAGGISLLGLMGWRRRRAA